MADIKQLEDSEINLIGVSILQVDMFIHIKSKLDPEDFTNKHCLYAYNAMSSLLNKDGTYDIIAVATFIDEHKWCAYDEARAFLRACVDAVPDETKVQQHINILKDKTLQRKYLAKINDIALTLKTKPVEDISSYISQCTNELSEISQTRRVADFQTTKEIIPEIVETLHKRVLEARKNGGKFNTLTGFSTGFESLDNVTGGLRRSEMIILAARPSVGKTAFSLNLMWNMAKQGLTVCFFSLEMNSITLMKRVVSKEARLSTSEIDTMDFDYTKDQNVLRIMTDSSDREVHDKLNTFQRAINNIANAKIYVDDSSKIKVDEIKSKVKNVMTSENVSAIFIDYLGLITPSIRSTGDNRVSEIRDISKNLKQLARECNIPVIVLSQLSRASEKRTNHKPMMSDLRDSGDIEQDADIIMTLWSKEYYENQEKGKTESNNVQFVQLSVLKNRNYRTGNVTFVNHKDKTDFFELDPSSPDPFAEDID